MIMRGPPCLSVALKQSLLKVAVQVFQDTGLLHIRKLLFRLDAYRQVARAEHEHGEMERFWL